ncbi:MAG TPA: ketol-acid reductoisomerase [Steroidobacteraceae bacterium]|nr:ketol-acid reductoisomerase [Steroidobacteraceae bacterium]
MKLYSQKDVDRRALKGARIAILGYGSQGRAHALNLKDSGFDVVVGVRKGGSGWQKARRDKLAVKEPAEAVAGADLVAILVPDPVQKEFYASIKGAIKKGATLLFAHGFNVHFRQIRPRKDLDVVLIAPKGPGDLVRRQYEQGRGVPCLLAVAQDASGSAHARALAYAHGIGGTRGGVLETTFAEETETDLFGEQAVLCGGCTELVVKGFETLVEAGYQPEVAYYECLHELKLIVDLLHEGGLAKMHQFVSETAKYGDLTRGPRIVNERVKKEMRKVLKEVQNGKFARQWIRENQEGRTNYQRLLNEDLERQIEKVGAALRARMPWLNEKRPAQSARPSAKRTPRKTRPKETSYERSSRPRPHI